MTSTISPDEAFAIVRDTVTLPPCPPWCVRGEGHEYNPLSVFIDEDAGYSIARHHLSQGLDRAHVSAWEVATKTGVSTRSLCIGLPEGIEDLASTAAARALIADLTAAADLLDEIQAAQR